MAVSTPDWVRLAVETDADREEWLTATLNELLGETTLEILDHRARQLVSELSGMDRGRILVRAYVSADEATDLYARLDALPNCVVHPLSPVTNNWKTDWQKFFRAVRVGQHFVVRPPWEQIDDPTPRDVDIVIDPGMAFGTGTHETTQLCLAALESLLGYGQTVLDVGCGSGVLSIAAAKMGANGVIAIDVDSEAVASAQANVTVNRVKETVDVSDTLLAGVPGEFDIVVANILSSVLVELRGSLYSRVKSEGHLLLSGILVDEIDYVDEQFSMLGLSQQRSLVHNDWACLHYRRRN